MRANRSCEDSRDVGAASYGRRLMARIPRPRLRLPGEGNAAIEFEPDELTGLLASPAWLRDLGISAWLLVGVAAALAGAIWFLAATETIVLPVIPAGIIASVAGPIVDWLGRH